MVNFDVVVYPREEMPTVHTTLPHVIISICDPGQRESSFAPTLNITNKTQAVVEINAHDIRFPVDGYVLFNQEQAHVIYQTICACEPKLVIVHCEAAISRSPAVALQLLRWQGKDFREYANIAKYLPNPHILGVMQNVANSYPI